MILREFPFPPTVNQCYPSNKQGRRFASAELKNFKHKAQVYAHQNHEKILKLKNSLVAVARTDLHYIQVEAYFERPPSKIWTKKITIRKQDVSNRVKALHDILSEILNIDDCYFCLGPTQFVEGTKERVHLRFKPIKIQHIDHIELND